jgi:hypothetical protein
VGRKLAAPSTLIAHTLKPALGLGILLQELQQEQPGESSGAALQLDKENVERALMARLSTPPTSYPQWPVQYLLGCYARASGQCNDTAKSRPALIPLHRPALPHTALCPALRRTMPCCTHHTAPPRPDAPRSLWNPFAVHH